MNDFNIEQYNITVTYDDSIVGDKDSDRISLNLYPGLEATNETECTIVLNQEFLSPKETHSCFRDWLITNLNNQRKRNSTKIALIEEVGEVRFVTYEELVDGSKRTANYMSHHGIKSGDKVLMCLENSVEYVFYQIGLFFLGAIPVLINPSHIASEKLEDIGCNSAIVDFENYENILQVSKKQLLSIERVFVLADDIATIRIPRNVWVIDGLGFLSFGAEIKRLEYSGSKCNIILSGSLTTPHYIAHTQKSSYYLCNGYFGKLQHLLDESTYSGKNNHLITNGLHCHDAFSYLFYIITKGETCVLTESTLDVWRASFLDRIAGIIDQYHVAILIANEQLMKCFVKYEVQNVYNLKSLKIITNHGSVFPNSFAKKIHKILDVTLIQAYSASEFGVISFGVVDGKNTRLADCGIPSDNAKIKIADLKTEKELGSGEWGQIILSGNQLCNKFLDNELNHRFVKSWFKTGDYGMIDENEKLHYGGSIEDLIKTSRDQVSSELIESVLCQHKLVDDSVVMEIGNGVWCGLLLRKENEAPTSEQLEKILKKHEIVLTIKKISILDFIPRSENGKVVRKEIPYLLRSQVENISVNDNNTESYI